MSPCFDQQRGIIHNDRMRVFFRDLLCRPLLCDRHIRVDDGIQPLELIGMIEDKRAQPTPVQRPIGVQHLMPERLGDPD